MALAGYMLVAAMMRTGPLAPIDAELKSYEVGNNSMAATFGVSPWVLIAILVAIVAFIVYRELKKPKVKIPSLKP